MQNAEFGIFNFKFKIGFNPHSTLRNPNLKREGEEDESVGIG
jgi:hypothetical protein